MRRIIIITGLVLIAGNVLVNKTSEALAPTIEVAEVKVKQVPKPLPLPKPKAIDIDQMHCLATNIYHEARGESIEGKFAVGHVTLNRVHSDRYPDTICGVVYQAELRENWKGNMVPKRYRCQFSWFCDGKSDDIILKTSTGQIIRKNMEAWEDSLDVATALLKHDIQDITSGATHYYNDKIADPFWADVYVKVAQIDNHVFHRQTTIY